MREIWGDRQEFYSVDVHHKKFETLRSSSGRARHWCSGVQGKGGKCFARKGGWGL